MKALFTGIFIIISIGVLYFVVQLVKSPEFKTSLTSTPTTFNTDPIADAKEASNIFVDVNNGFSFAYPKGWQPISPEKIRGFAPLIRAETGQYLTVSKTLMRRDQNMDIDIESITTELPKSIRDGIDVLAGEAMDLKTTEVKKLIFKNGFTGFRLTFEGQTKGDVLVAQYLKGNIYAYYVRGEILLAYSVNISSEKSELVERRTPDFTPFLQEADIALQNLTIY